ncbi:peptide/nickel transport system substrate-binding protein [Rhizobiales bacterium GAS191]|nr:peptide/nickel transport system substrate-binding protein [Rhizobiales bacterium GAS191]
MSKLRNNDGSKLHPAAGKLSRQVVKGEISRRQFLRTVALLGVAVPSAEAFLSGTIRGLAPTPAQAQETPRQGGVLRFQAQIQEITDPMLSQWIDGSNVYRQSLEYLTEVDADNITKPFLAESWKPSEDLKIWVFKIRQGVKWSNGDDFDADDVLFNFKRWTAPDSKSNLKTSFSMLKSVEKTGSHEITLTLDKSVLSIPEMLYAQNAPILHRKFDEQGGNWPKNPIGTGPFQMTDYAVAQRASFKRRDGYWGKPAYLDEIRFLNLGNDRQAHIAALIANQVDVLYGVSVTELDLVEKLPQVKLLREKAANTVCIRMRSAEKPYDDERVRKAIVLAADNKRMLELGIRNQGSVGENHHVAPFHPEYAPLPPVVRDVAKAKALLAEAGYKDGIDIELMVGNTQGLWEQNTAQVLQQSLAEAGIRLKLNVVPSAQYWPVWTKVAFGMTYWAHRPLGVIAMDLAYRTGASWNESGYANPEFDKALDLAMAEVDPKKRSVHMAKTEKILQDSAVMIQPFWLDKLTAVSPKVRNYHVHPSDFFKLHEVWLAA